MRKKQFLFTLSLYIIIAIIMYIPYILLANNEKVTISADFVSVREAPTMDSAVLTQVTNGDVFPVKSHKDGWYKIKLSTGQIGYIDDTLANTKSQPSKRAIVISEHLNVRSDSSTSSEVLGQLSLDSEVHIVNEKKDWTEIMYDDGTAWVSSQYIREIDAFTNPNIADGNKSFEVISLHDGTNIHKKPKTRSKVITKTKANQTYEVIRKVNDWYEIKIDKGKKGYISSWLVSYVTKKNDSKGLPGIENKTIVIDPGHGGKDKGTTSITGIFEKDLTLPTAELLANALKKKGATVILTRDSDEFISLDMRKQIAEQNEADLFISIHYDSIEDHSIHGHTTYYYYDYEEEVAELVNNHLEDELTIRNRGLKHGDYFVLRESQVPAILLELGYLSNENEVSIIQTNTFQNQAVKGITDALTTYFK